MERVVVIGTSCSGKTTLARQLASALECPHVELDMLNWMPGWTPRPIDELREVVREVTSGPRWVIDGNYSKVRDIVWSRATHVVWLNYPFFIVFFRALRRTLHRVFRKEDLFAGNRETLRLAFFDRDSILLWVLKTYRRRRWEYPQLFALAQYRHLTVIELKSPAEAERMLGRFAPSVQV